MRGGIIVFLILAVSQIAGWGAVGFVAVVARDIAGDLGMGLPAVFLGSSVMFVAMAVAAPVAGRGFRRFGARRVMAAGAAIIGGGLGVIAVAPGPVAYFAGWALAGTGGAMFLTTAAYVYLAGFADTAARGRIGTLMLVTGLAGSVFWPVTGVLDHLLGWRGAVAVYAMAMACLVAPLVLFGLPEAGAGDAADAARNADRGGRPAGRRQVFVLIVAAVALNGFVSFGIESVGIELFRAMGTELTHAVAIAAALGLFKLAGRIVDLAGGRRWDALSTALVAGVAMPLGLAAVGLSGAGPGLSTGAVAAYLVLFGIGSGAFAVARATMPLVFYRRADYAAAMSAIAVPLNLINALAPPVLAGLLVAAGPRAVLGLMTALGALALVLLLLRLGRLRPAAAPGGELA